MCWAWALAPMSAHMVSAQAPMSAQSPAVARALTSTAPMPARMSVRSERVRAQAIVASVLERMSGPPMRASA